MNRYDYIRGAFVRPAINYPTLVYMNDKYWFKDNKYVEDPNKSPSDWGELHRVNGPAIEWANGHKEWCLNGKRHRTDGPAIEWTNRLKSWWLNNRRHRTDGPAIEWANGHKEWFLNGKLHRIDGPAIEYVDGSKSWWLNGERLTEDGFNAKIQNRR